MITNIRVFILTIMLIEKDSFQQWPDKIVVGVLTTSTDVKLNKAVIDDTIRELKRDGVFPKNLFLE